MVKIENMSTEKERTKSMSSTTNCVNPQIELDEHSSSCDVKCCQENVLDKKNGAVGKRMEFNVNFEKPPHGNEHIYGKFHRIWLVF